MQLSISQLLAYRTIYNHPRDVFLLYWICNYCRWPIRRSTFTQKMRFICTEYAIVDLPVAGLSDGQYLKDAFLPHWVCNCCLPVVSLSDGLQSPNGRLSPALSMQLSVFWSLAYRRVYNHPMDAFLLLWVCNRWSPSCRPIGRSIIIKGCTRYAIVVVGLLDGLQSSKGCVSPALSMQLSVSWSLAYRTVYNHLRECVSLAMSM